jgi:hypothetical protein
MNNCSDDRVPGPVLDHTFDPSLSTGESHGSGDEQADDRDTCLEMTLHHSLLLRAVAR